MRKILLLSAITLLGPGQAPEVLAQVECSIASLQAKAPKGTTITGAAVMPAADKVASYCRVDGHVSVPGNEVNFRLGLPERLERQVLFLRRRRAGRPYRLARQGPGARLRVGLDRHRARADDRPGDRIARRRSTTAIAALTSRPSPSKALTAAFYAQPVQHAYFEGCSNGGRQAFMEVQRYPDDFDGIIGGHPATGTPMQVGRALVYQHMLASPDNYPHRRKDRVALEGDARRLR